MEKCLKYVFLCIFLFTLTGCKKESYALIEVSSPQVIEAINDGKSFILASLNQTDTKKEQYKKDLEELAQRKKENIYYISSEHTVFADEIVLYEYLGIDMLNLSFSTFQKGELIETEKYSSYSSLYSMLENYRYKDTIPVLDSDTITDTLTNVRTQYEEGYIAEAYNLLSSIWSSKEAKEEYENNSYYKIIKEWESYEMLDNGNARCTYLSFYPFENTIYEASKVDLFSSFEAPDFDDFTSKEYKIKDNIIYIKEENSEYYKKEYKIKFIGETKMVLKKGKKEYTFLIAG